jgi:hypothetical protein
MSSTRKRSRNDDDDRRLELSVEVERLNDAMVLSHWTDSNGFRHRAWLRWKNPDDEIIHSTLLHALPETFPTDLTRIHVLDYLGPFCPLHVLEVKRDTPYHVLEEKRGEKLRYHWKDRPIDGISCALFRRIRYCAQYYPEVFSTAHVYPLLNTIRDWLLHSDQIFLWKPATLLNDKHTIARAPQESVEHAVSEFVKGMLPNSYSWNGTQLIVQRIGGAKSNHTYVEEPTAKSDYCCLNVEEPKPVDCHQWEPFFPTLGLTVPRWHWHGGRKEQKMIPPHLDNMWSFELPGFILIVRPFLMHEYGFEFADKPRPINCSEEWIKTRIPVTIFNNIIPSETITWIHQQDQYFFAETTSGFFPRRFCSPSYFHTIPLSRLVQTLSDKR